MANPEHVNLLRGDPATFNLWRARSPDVPLDLSEADLRGLVFENLDFGVAANFYKANLSGARFKDVRCVSADVRGADLRDLHALSCTFSECDFEAACMDRASFTACNFERAKLQIASLIGSRFENVNLTHAHFEATKADGIEFEGVEGRGTNFAKASLRASKFLRSRLLMARFDRTDIAYATFFETNLAEASFFEVNGAPKSHGLETCDVHGLTYFETCKRGFADRWLSWEMIRNVGEMPLFGISYSVMIALPLAFAGLSAYNRLVESLRAWAKNPEVAVDPTWARAADFIQTHLHRQPIPEQSLLLLVSTVLLAIASTLYAVRCPPRVKEATQEKWQFQLGFPLAHYWPSSWSRPITRVICAFCYVVGGVGALWVLIWKIWHTAVFIWTNSFIEIG